MGRDKFMWKAGDLQTVGICNFCRHLRARGCAAFPWGIPDEIRSGAIDHTKPVEGDNGIQFERWEPEE